MHQAEQLALHAVVHGRVHGVGFRYSTIMQAQRLRLVGYVRNVFDGTVEVVAEGPKEGLTRLISWLKKGPPLAHVTNLDYNFKPISGKYRSFSISYSI